jgi:peptidoglycan/LPS O-acetylase OafA/YrhL
MNEQGLIIPETLNTSKIPSLDGLRAISILLVLVAHCFYDLDYKIAKLGSLGVEIFFVISGFLITTLLLKEKAIKNKISLKNFYIRRGLRILPVIFLFLFALLILNHVYQLHISNRSFMTAVFFAKNIPIYNSSEWYTGHLWSLAVEEQFYIIFPVIISLLSLKNYKRLVIFLIIFLTILNYCFHSFADVLYSNKFNHRIVIVIVNLLSSGTVSILVGSFFSVLLFYNSAFLNRLININSYFLSLIIFLIALVLRFPYFHLYMISFTNTIYAFMIGIVIMMNLNKACLMAKILNLKFITQIGILSYSLYIWQQLFSNNQPWEKTFIYADSLLLNLPILFLVAYLSYRYYEKKFLNIKDRFKIVK